MHNELIDWQLRKVSSDALRRWKPMPLDREQWPPNYAAVYAWRIKTLRELRKSPEMLASAKAYYSIHRKEFIMHWMDTYDPRKKDGPKWMPFVFFIKQSDFIDYLDELRRDSEGGLVEKARDMGATWLACGYSTCSD